MRFFCGNFVSLPVDKVILQSSREKPEGFWTRKSCFFVLLSGCFLTKKKTVSERNVKKQEVES